jgi:hypothetical protein
MSDKKCVKCKKLLNLTNFKQKSNGELSKTCIECLEKDKKFRKQNKCSHGKLKRYCKECDGSAFCEHGKRKEYCKECGGSAFCEHGKQKYYCKKCGGSAFCEHGKQKRYCKECDGSAFCEHGNRKQRCKECDGSELCEHGKHKYYCKECGGSAFCEHGKQKRYCIECDGSELCEHGKQKYYCKECGGSRLCPNCKYTSHSKRYVKEEKKYVKLCAGCFYHLYPNEESPYRYKKKQNYIHDALTDRYGLNFFEYDRAIKCENCSRYPDWLKDCGEYYILIECDEEQHKDRIDLCERKREIELFEGLNYKPLIIIRFNPDKYKINNGTKSKTIRGCFSFTGNDLKPNQTEINKRFPRLFKEIDDALAISNTEQKLSELEPIKVIPLFFDYEIDTIEFYTSKETIHFYYDDQEEYIESVLELKNPVKDQATQEEDDCVVYSDDCVDNSVVSDEYVDNSVVSDDCEDVSDICKDSIVSDDCVDDSDDILIIPTPIYSYEEIEKELEIKHKSLSSTQKKPKKIELIVVDSDDETPDG